MSGTDDPNEMIQKHEAAGNCDPEKRKKIRRVTCFACSTVVTETNSVSCSKCLQRVCIKHRSMEAHDCLGRPPSKLLGMSNRNVSDFANREKPGEMLEVHKEPEPVVQETHHCPVCNEAFTDLGALVAHSDSHFE